MTQNLLWSHSTEVRDKPLAQSTNGSNTWSPFCLCPLYCPLPNYSQITSWRCEDSMKPYWQTNGAVFCDAPWFDCDALWCSSQISFYFCRRKASRAPISPYCFYSWPHTQNPGCSYPTPLPSFTINFRWPGTLQSSSLLLQFGVSYITLPDMTTSFSNQMPTGIYSLNSEVKRDSFLGQTCLSSSKNSSFLISPTSPLSKISWKPWRKVL